MESQNSNLQRFSAEEKAAMKERQRELKAEARRETSRADGERVLLDKIDEMAEPDKSICKRLHQTITANAPELLPKTWYGMPAYANSDGKVILFFRDTQKFKERYITLGFNEQARLDDGEMWPIAYAIKSLSDGERNRIAVLVRKAVSSDQGGE